MHLYPTTVPEDQTDLSYFFLGAILTTLFGFLWVPWVGFLCACLWGGLALWNVVIGPSLVEGWDGAESAKKPTTIGEGMEAFATGQIDDLRKQVAELRRKIDAKEKN